MCRNYNQIDFDGIKPIKAWTKGVNFEEKAFQQVKNAASLDFVHSHIAIMPDVHYGKGATIGSVIPSIKAIIPAAVGVDIGCGMLATKTSLTAEQLPDNLFAVRQILESAIPHGRTNKNPANDKGAWGNIPPLVASEWLKLQSRFEKITEKYPLLKRTNTAVHLGTMGSGNHFLELCIDENDGVWIMIHSESRGVGAAFGGLFIELAKKEMEAHQVSLPDMDLAYLKEGSQYFDDYVEAVEWAQDFAAKNREIMMHNAISALRKVINLNFKTDALAVNCHHNYVSKEHHYGKECYVTRKGAVRAKKGELGIIPGSMGTRSYIVRGLGNHESFESCSHGAGRVMSRTKAKKIFNIKDHEIATEGVECRKDVSVIDEIPLAYKDIDKVMEAQKDLVEVVHTLKQVVCVKG